MSEVVIPDVSHAVCLEQIGKCSCYIMRLNQIANLIDTDMINIVLDVAASAQATVFLLLFLEGKKSFSHKRYERKCSHT